MLTVLLIVCAAWCFAANRKWGGKYGNDGLEIGGMFLVVTGGLGIIIKAILIGNVIMAPISLKQNELRIKLYQERLVEVEQSVRKELDRYPEYEERILGKVDPAILLKYPELKSNQTITEGFKSLIQYQQIVTKLKDKSIEIEFDRQKMVKCTIIF
jgi:hypothetical protein